MPGWSCPTICIAYTLPPGDVDFSSRWREIKKYFSRRLPKIERLSAVRSNRHERGIWQRRFWEHALRDDADYSARIDYVHINPLKHSHVKSVADWPYPTFHRYVRQGIYPIDWVGPPEPDIEAGERE